MEKSTRRACALAVALCAAQSAMAAEVGTTAGAFEVSPSGAATYTVPITTPPGVGGVQPSLSITYNSPEGNGLLGMGFSLAGLSSITRCLSALEPDGFIDPVDFDSDDRYCFDGQRLVAVSGAYGGVGTEYRTEIDGLSKIVSYGGSVNDPGYFKVWTKAGVVMEFGSTADARVEAVGRTQAASWHVSRISDSVTNYMTFGYIEDSVTGEHRISRVDYTGNTTSGSAPNASVEFDYEPRLDPFVHHVGGTTINFAQRLKAVRTEVAGAAVRQYNLAYETGTATGASRLIRIEECPGVGTCLPPTTFTYQEGAGGVLALQSTYATSSLHENSNMYSADFTGDGQADLLFFNGASGYLNLHPVVGGIVQTASYSAQSFHEGHAVLIGDFDADGISDVAFFDSGLGRLYIHPVRNGVVQAASYSASSFHELTVAQTGDFNGDGYTDLVFWKRDTGLIYIHPVINGVVQAASYSTGGLHPQTDVRTGDFNGDGVLDLAFQSADTGTFHIHPVQNGVVQAATFSNNNGFHPQYGLVVGNFNGDRTTDVAFWDRATGRLYLHLIKDGVPQSPFFYDGDYHEQHDLLVGDFNYDSIHDLVFWKADTAELIIHPVINGTVRNATVWATGFHEGSKVEINDFDGDGIVDASFWHEALGRAYVHLATGDIPDLAKRITNGLGAVVEADYKPLTDSSIYTKGTGAPYPLVNVRGPQYVVSERRSTDGVGGLRRATYQYANSQVHLRGRGSLGFAQRTVSDEATSIRETTDARLDFPFTGMPTKTTVATYSGKIISESEAAYDKKVLGSGATTRYFVHPATSIERKREINGANPVVISTVTSSEYNEPLGAFFGNLSRGTVWVYPGHESGGSAPFTTVNVSTYSNDSSQWFLGRLLRSEVTRTSPEGDTGTRVSAFEYDAYTGLLMAEEIEPDLPAYRLRTAYQRDVYGNITRTTVSGAGFVSRETIKEFDARGQFVLRVINALGHTEQHQYDPASGNIMALTGPNNLTTRWLYDAFGRKTRELAPDGTWTEVKRQWCAGGSPSCSSGSLYKISTKGSTGAEAFSEHDVLERPVVAMSRGFDGGWVKQLTQFNAKGQVYRKSVPHDVYGSPYWTTVTYDAAGRVAQENAPVDQNITSGKTTTFTYSGLTTVQTNALSQTITHVVNALGKEIETRDHMGSKIVFKYDAFDNLVRTIDQPGNEVVMEYDIRGRKTTMDDPDMGVWTYTYNALGELVTQRDAKLQTMWMAYDLLGRMVSRADIAEGTTTTWAYDTRWKGALTSVTSPGYIRDEHYDGLGRVIGTDYTVGGGSYGFDYTFDTQGRVKSIAYPSGFWVAQQYNAYGYMSRVSRASIPLADAINCAALPVVNDLPVPTACELIASTSEIWRLDATDAWGHEALSTLGNAVETMRSNDLANGLLSAIQTTAQGAAPIQSLNYTWDKVGNLKTRVDQLQGGLTELFDYDAVNRLQLSRVIANGSNVLTDVAVTYNTIGNITSKSGYGTYSYGSRPHAVTSTSGANGLNAATYSYDANGNMTAGAGRTIAWTSYNLPRLIQQNGNSIEYRYGPARERISQITAALTVTYAGGLYERHSGGAAALNKNYVQAGGRIVAIYTQPDSQQGSLQYLHYDHRDSVDAITNEAGGPVERFAYDAFGKRRTLNWLNDPSDSQMKLPHATSRGFTSQEHLDGVGLIHYGGRVYDPGLGRFTSADPIIQAPLDLQSYNRYSYVRNNPLTLTDPSGFSWWSKARRHVGRAFLGGTGFAIYDHGVRHSSTFRSMAAVVAGGVDVGILYGVPILSTFNSTYSSRRLGASWHDSLRAGAITAGTAYAFHSAGSYFPAPIENTIAHGVVGGLSSVAQGGKFGAGFLSGALPAGVGNADWIPRDPALGAVVSALLGGTASELGGGKFANGAVTGAFGYLFNRFAHEWHQYRAGPNQVCSAACTDTEMADYLSRHAVPGQDSSVPVTDDSFNKVYDPRTGAYGGEVLTNISPDGLTVTNTTLPGHVFSDGQITRTAFRGDGGAWYVETRGWGLNRFAPGMGMINQWQGPKIFNYMDRQMRSYIDSHR